MKKIILYILPLVLFYLFGCSAAQTIQLKDMKYEVVRDYSDVPDVKIFEGAMRWIAFNAIETGAVIDYKDKDAGNIIVKAYTKDLKEGTLFPYRIYFTLSVEAKNNKARYRFEVTQVVTSDNALADKPTEADVKTVSKIKFDSYVDGMSAEINKRDF